MRTSKDTHTASPISPPLQVAPGGNVQLKRSLVGQGFEAQEAALAPPPGGTPPVQMKGEDKSFEKVATGGPMSEKDTPASMQLPDEMTKGMKTAMDESFPGGKSQEQGGILTRNNKDGSYALKRGPAGNTGSFSFNRGDATKDETIVGTGHTHPYDASEGGHENVSFSGADIAYLVYKPDPIMMVQAGPTQFVIVRTKEFDDQVKVLDDPGKAKLYKQINDDWNSEFSNNKGMKLPERVEKTVKAVLLKYKLSYYRGKEGKVDKVDTSK